MARMRVASFPGARPPGFLWQRWIG